MSGVSIPAAALAALTSIPLDPDDLDGQLRHVCEVTIDVVGGADAASVSLITNGHPKTLGATSDMATAADDAQYLAGAGPCLDAAQANEVVVVPDLSTEMRWPATDRMAEAGARSSLSLPLPIQAEAIAGLNIYSTRVAAFDEAAVQTAMEFASFAAVAVANAMTLSTAAEQAKNLQAAMEHRSVIEQAKGILIATTGRPPEEAFNLLVQQSQHENRKLREIAHEIVDGAIRGGAKGVSKG